MRLSLRFKKEITMIKLLINEDGQLCDLHHKGIEDGRIYRTLIVAERTESHFQALVSAVGHIKAQNTRNLAELFDKGHRIVRED